MEHSSLPYGAKMDDGDSDSDLGLQDNVPYSSSSVDSIPWADDAIKQNQLDWERVERMLSGDNPLPTEDEPELRNEIIEWHRKFPSLYEKHHAARSPLQKQQLQSFDSSATNAPNDDILDLDSLSNLSLNSVDDDGGDLSDTETLDGHHQRTVGYLSAVNDAQLPPQQTAGPQRTFRATTHKLQRVFGAMHGRLRHNNDDLCVTSVPVKLRQRHQLHQENGLAAHQRRHSGSETSSSASMPSTPTGARFERQQHRHVRRYGNNNNNQGPLQQAALRMPPILNVLESKRRFTHGLASNRSFVQLTQVQQAKSAAAVITAKTTAAAKSAAEAATSANHNGKLPLAAAEGRRQRNQSAWQVPLAATAVTQCFFNNNRNAIILPAIDLQRIGVHHALAAAAVTLTSTSTQSDNRSNGHVLLTGSTTNTSDGGIFGGHSGGGGGGGSALQQLRGMRTHVQRQHHHHPTYAAKIHPNFNGIANAVSTTPTSTSLASMGGRSISAAVQPRSEFRAFYLPYSATKFKSFK